MAKIFLPLATAIVIDSNQLAAASSTYICGVVTATSRTYPLFGIF